MSNAFKNHFNSIMRDEGVSTTISMADNNNNIGVALMFSEEFKKYLPGGELPKDLPDFPWTKYKDSDWDESAQAAIPKDEHIKLEPELLWELCYEIEHGGYPLLLGPPGCGKTSSLRMIAHHRNQPFLRMPSYQDMDSSTIIGSETVKGGNIEYKMGIFSQAFKDGWLILWDEKHRTPGAIAFVLQEAVEKKGNLLLPNADGNVKDRTVLRGKSTRIVAADNSLGFGDKEGFIYEEQDISGLDRYTKVLSFNYLQPNDEIELYSKYFNVSKPCITDIVAFANMTRNHFQSNSLLLGLTTRSIPNLLKMLALYKTYDVRVVKDRMTTVFFNKIPEDQFPQILSLFENTFSSSKTYINP